MKKKPSPVLRRRRLCLFAAGLIVFSVFIFAYAHHPVNKPSESGFIRAVGETLVDGEGNEIRLRGTNIGSWLVPEGWMSILLIDGQDDIQEGKNLTYLKLIQALADNPDVGSVSAAEELYNVFIENWFTEADVAFLKSSGFNCIRLPFGWFTLYDQDFQLRADAYKWLDRCVEWCEKYEMYLLLDCHAAFGSQNGKHHSGDDTQCSLYSDKRNMELTTQMWVGIAQRYRGCKWIAGYDLLNEPEGRGGLTWFTQWNYYDELYRAIRKVDPNHLIIIESCWVFQNLPNPALYGWENVAYEFHWYNPDTKNITMQNFIRLQSLSRAFSVYRNVPVIIGEFALGDHYDDLEMLLDHFDKKGWSWMSWTYKTNTSWNWGMLCLWRERLSVSHASCEEISAAWQDVRSDFNARSEGFQNLERYLSR